MECLNLNSTGFWSVDGVECDTYSKYQKLYRLPKKITDDEEQNCFFGWGIPPYTTEKWCCSQPDGDAEWDTGGCTSRFINARVQGDATDDTGALCPNLPGISTIGGENVCGFTKQNSDRVFSWYNRMNSELRNKIFKCDSGGKDVGQPGNTYRIKPEISIDSSRSGQDGYQFSCDYQCLWDCDWDKDQKKMTSCTSNSNNKTKCPDNKPLEDVLYGYNYTAVGQSGPFEPTCGCKFYNPKTFDIDSAYKKYTSITDYGSTDVVINLCDEKKDGNCTKNGSYGVNNWIKPLDCYQQGGQSTFRFYPQDSRTTITTPAYQNIFNKNKSLQPCLPLSGSRFPFNPQNTSSNLSCCITDGSHQDNGTHCYNGSAPECEKIN